MRISFKWLGLAWGVAFAMGTGTALAADEAPVAFVDPAALTTSCAELEDGEVLVPVRNETAAVQKVRFVPQLSNENGRFLDLAGVCGGLTWTPEDLTLEPGAAAAISLAAEEDADARTLSGSFALFADEGRVSRKEVKIAEAQQQVGRDLDATPLVSGVDADFLTSERGPIWVPVEGESPAAADGGKGTAPETVGAVSGPGGPVAVVFRGETDQLGAGDSKLVLELDEEVGPGTYTGKADLAPEDPEKGTVDLELKISKSGWLAAAVLILGILVGIGVLSASNRMLPAARLRGQVEGLAARHRKAVGALTEAGGGKSWSGFRVKNLRDLQDGIKEQISAATRKVLVTMEPTVVKNIETEIAAVEAQVDLLKEVPKHAPPLEEALLVPRPGDLPPGKGGTQPQGQPALEAKAASALVGRALDAGEIKAAIEEMDRRAREMATLRRLERKLEELWIEKKGLVKNLGELERRLAECRSSLWAATGAEGLEEAAKLLEKAQEELVRVRSAGGSTNELTAVESSALSAAKLAPVLGGADAPPVPIVIPVVPVPPLADEDASAAVDKAFWVQLGIVVFSALFAIATGLEALYADKAWGSSWDLLAAFVWGAVGQALVSTLATNLDSLRGLGSLRRP